MSQKDDKTVENMKQGQTVTNNDNNAEKKAADMIDSDLQEMEKESGSEELSDNSSILNREAVQAEAEEQEENDIVKETESEEGSNTNAEDGAATESENGSEAEEIIEPDISAENEKEDSDELGDLVFVDEKSVRERSKLVKTPIAQHKDVKKKKTKRRAADTMEIQKEKSIAYMKRNITFIGIGILVVIVVIAAIVTGVKKYQGKKHDAPAISVSDSEITASEDKEINELMKSYFNAYAENDTETLDQIAKPLTDREKEYIKIYSEYVEKYENIVCYTSKGAQDGSDLVAVYYEIKFDKIRKTAPGMMFFYVSTGSDGKKYIDNAYSPYNTTYQETETDAAITALMAQFQADSGIVSLTEEIQKRYDEALAEDESLKTMLETTLPDAIAQWSQVGEQQEDQNSDQTQQDQAQQDQTQQDQQQAQQDQAQQDQQQQQVTETPASGMVYATDLINIRQYATTDSMAIGSAAYGSEMTRLAVTSDGWTKIQTGNLVGYVRNDMISDQKPASQAGQPTPGQSIYLQDTINIRESMSETSTRLAVAYSGETAVVAEVYPEGWCKVNVNGIVGYVRTDVLAGAM